ncbi:hypothetical protein GC194_05930 [bacterium]|nr:hypothetical protein [bacterium]
MKQLLTTIFLSTTLSCFAPSNTSVIWQNLEAGLDYGSFTAPLPSVCGDRIIDILRIDPHYFQINLFSAKEGDPLATAEDWAGSKKQLAVFNAGMYQGDHKTNVGFMQDFNFINNSKLNDDNAILAFNPKNEHVAPVQIIDRKCQDWEQLKNDYNSFSQSIRMVDCQQKNRWAQQNLKWSTLATAVDKKGRLLFVFTRSPFSVHDFIAMLLNSDLDIYNMMYLEGGPEASFYLNHPNKKVAKMGSYETGFWEDDSNKEFWQIPNVIGIERK